MVSCHGMHDINAARARVRWAAGLAARSSSPTGTLGFTDGLARVAVGADRDANEIA
jgi:hypothetical protein